MKKLNNLLEHSVWIPILGILSMGILTQLGRYRYVYFAGYIWPLYQLVCFSLILIIPYL